jgi:hypothetical protein
MHERPIDTLLEEYQDYVMADRLRRTLGGRVKPSSRLLNLRDYARIRLERQDLAKKLVRKEIPLAGLGRIDELTEQINYGFWRNPGEVAAFLRAALRQGGHPALSQPEAFEGLLSPLEHSRLGQARGKISSYYQNCLKLAAPIMDPLVFEHAYAKVEAGQPGLFIDELNDDAGAFLNNLELI